MSKNVGLVHVVLAIGLSPTEEIRPGHSYEYSYVQILMGV